MKKQGELKDQSPREKLQGQFTRVKRSVLESWTAGLGRQIKHTCLACAGPGF